MKPSVVTNSVGRPGSSNGFSIFYRLSSVRSRPRRPATRHRFQNHTLVRRAATRGHVHIYGGDFPRRAHALFTTRLRPARVRPLNPRICKFVSGRPVGRQPIGPVADHAHDSKATGDAEADASTSARRAHIPPVRSDRRDACPTSAVVVSVHVPAADPSRTPSGKPTPALRARPYRRAGSATHARRRQTIGR